MGTLLVVLDHPPVSCLPDFGQVSEQVQVQQFISIRTVEALDIGILVRFARLDVLN